MYKPSKKDQETIKFVYSEFAEMQELRQRSYKQFNNRTLVEFIDDSEKRANSYIPDRETQGKANWQANFFHPVTRNKLKAIIATISRNLPNTKITAISDKLGVDIKRAEIISELVRYSRLQSNAEIENFFDVWTTATHGTVIKYEGYAYAKQKVRLIKSYDPETGEVESEEKDVVVKDGCVETIVPIRNLLVKDYFIHDIQDQPSLAWADGYDRSTFMSEFGHLKLAKDVQEIGDIKTEEGRNTFMSKEWQSFVKEFPYHVIRYYNKYADRYEVVANGVLLISTPLLWGNEKKKYPFAKTIFEPFAGKEFFYGNSLPNSLLGEQDVINTLYNTMVDKSYRSLVKPLLVGEINEDAFDLEDEIISHDTKIPVADINQVKELDIAGVNQSDIEMVKIVSQGLDLSSVDQVQQGISGSGSTAREIVIANQRAEELRTIFYMFLADLWRQKTILRINNILMYYTLPKVEKILKDGTKEYKKFLVPDHQDKDGKKGYLEINVVEDKTKLPTSESLEVDQEVARRKGVELRKLAITKDYLDDFEYDVSVDTNSVYRNDRGEKQAVFNEKLQILATVFPDVIQQNKNVFLKDFFEAYGDDIGKYNIGEAPPNLPTPGAPGATAPAAGMNAEALPSLMDSLAKAK